MQIAKHKLVNALFLLGFPCYGIGSFLSIKQNYSVGIVFGVWPKVGAASANDLASVDEIVA